MNTDLNFLFEFLAQTDAEVAGRALPEPEGHVRQLLERFARGECAADERADVCRMIRLHTPWMHWVANRVKLERQAQAKDERDDLAAAG
jgi:hypothetical protein